MLTSSWGAESTTHDGRRVKNCGYGGVYSNHTWVYACDIEPDGYGYAIVYELQSGAGGSVPDSNGSAAGCGSRRVGTTANPVVLFQLCNVTLHLCTSIARA
jgi:hypothetical protein